MAGPEQYLQTRVMTASPYELHLIVVSGAIRYAAQAGQALERRDFEAAHDALGKSRAFVGEMIAGLDPQHAPDVVGSLRALFGFVWNRLALADVTHDPRHVGDALHVLESHRETWRELAPQTRTATREPVPDRSAAVPPPHFATEKSPTPRLSRVL